MKMRSLIYSLPVVACAIALACSGSSPTEPGAIEPNGGSTRGTAVQHDDGPNTAPTLVLKTKPPLQEGIGDLDYVQGLVGTVEKLDGSGDLIVDENGSPVMRLRVEFNLTGSTDAEDGTGRNGGLNCQYHFGDNPDNPNPVNSDGTFNSEAGQQCKLSHDYGEGAYVATVSVTDRHQQDNEVGTLARTTKQVRIIAQAGNRTTSLKRVVSPEASWLESLWG